jgi:predicted ATPase
MISKIEALGYRCLRYVAQELGGFHVLVGPNASGKSAFLDVPAFMSDVISLSPADAVLVRASDLRDLLWMREGDRLELAIEVSVPDERRKKLNHSNDGRFERARYELAIGLRGEDGEPALLAETFWLIPKDEDHEIRRPPSRTLFPEPPRPPESILRGAGRAPQGWKKIVNKVVESGNDYFSSETSGWNNLFRLGPRKSALANLPEDEVKFPVATWFKELLMLGVQKLALDSDRMRQSSPPLGPKEFVPDGSTLPWVVERLASRHRSRFNEWIRHVKTAVPDLRTVRTVERSEDRHRYLVLEFENGLKVPSWAASDGTLRLLALTLLAYLPDIKGVFLIEEPENGIHPRAIETLFQSLSSVYGAQVLLATHSPVILSVAKPEQVLCFARTGDGATDIVRGSEHPALRNWKGEVNLGTLFAAGVLSEGQVHAG